MEGKNREGRSKRNGKRMIGALTTVMDAFHISVSFFGLFCQNRCFSSWLCSHKIIASYAISSYLTNRPITERNPVGRRVASVIQKNPVFSALFAIHQSRLPPFKGLLKVTWHRHNSNSETKP